MDKILSEWPPEDKEKNTEQDDPSVWRMDGIDVEVGMSYSDNDRVFYLEMLTDFADNIEAKAGIIERAAKERDLATYIMQVHSLKSGARYLGALAFADMAQSLETDARKADWDAVDRRMPEFLFSYRKLYQSIAPYRIEKTYAAKKKRFDREAVLLLLAKLSECMEQYDMDAGGEIVRTLAEYDVEGVWSDCRDRITRAADRFDYNVCKEEALSWKQALEKEL